MTIFWELHVSIIYVSSCRALILGACRLRRTRIYYRACLLLQSRHFPFKNWKLNMEIVEISHYLMTLNNLRILQSIFFSFLLLTFIYLLPGSYRMQFLLDQNPCPENMHCLWFIRQIFGLSGVKSGSPYTFDLTSWGSDPVGPSPYSLKFRLYVCNITLVTMNLQVLTLIQLHCSKQRRCDKKNWPRKADVELQTQVSKQPVALLAPSHDVSPQISWSSWTFFIPINRYAGCFVA